MRQALINEAVQHLVLVVVINANLAMPPSLLDIYLRLGVEQYCSCGCHDLCRREPRHRQTGDTLPSRETNVQLTICENLLLVQHASFRALATSPLPPQTQRLDRGSH